MKAANDMGFRKAFVAAVTSGTANFVETMVAAAMGSFGKALHEPKVEKQLVTNVGKEISQDLKAEGFAEKTVSNRASVARKIVRCRTFLESAVGHITSDKRFETGARGFDQQTLERILTACNKAFDGEKEPKNAAIATIYFDSLTPTKVNVQKKAASALKALVNSGVRSAAWRAVIDAAVKEADKQGLEY